MYFLLIVAITYGLTKGIEKHASRYVSLIMLIITHLVVCIICIKSFLIKKEIIFFIIGGISIFLFVCNILGILLPNLNCCQKLRYDYDPNLINNNDPMSQNSNDKTTILNQNTNKTPLDIEETAYEYEKNYEKPEINQINDFSEQNSICSDLGNVPLPSDHLPTESEINQNKNV